MHAGGPTLIRLLAISISASVTTRQLDYWGEAENLSSTTHNRYIRPNFRCWDVALQGPEGWVDITAIRALRVDTVVYHLLAGCQGHGTPTVVSTKILPSIYWGSLFCLITFVSALYTAFQSRGKKYSASNFVKNVHKYFLSSNLCSVAKELKVEQIAISNLCKRKIISRIFLQPTYVQYKGFLWAGCISICICIWKFFFLQPTYVQCKGFSWADWRCLDISLASGYLQFGH